MAIISHTSPAEAPLRRMESVERVPLLVEVARTFRQMAVILKSNESKKEHKIFYSNFMAFCLLVEGHAIRIQATASPNSPIICSVLDRFQSLTTGHVFQRLSNTPKDHSSSQLWVLNHYWNLTCPKTPATQLQFVRASLDFGTPDQRNDLIDFFWKWQDDFLAQYPEDTSFLSVEEAVRPAKLRSEPSYAVWAAAQALYEALVASEKCECEHMHDYSARLGLKTFRTVGLGFDDDFDFEMFLALEQFWQEMQVRTVTQSIVKFAINEANTQTPERSPNGRRMRVKELCKVIRKLQDRPSLRLKCMVENRQLWKLLSEKTNSAIDRSKPPVSLEQFITANSRYLNEKTKRILAILLSYAVLHFYGTPWLQPSWGSSNIIFFQTKSSAIPLKPFLQTTLRSWNNSEVPGQDRKANGDPDDDDADPDDLFEHHPCPPLVTLATVLIEVYLATPFKMLAKRYNVDLASTGDGSPQYLEVLQVFEECRSEIPENSQFRLAVDNCLNFSLWQDENFNTLDKEKLRCVLYEEVVRPLEDELSHAFSYISIEELDKIAQDLDFGNWGESIQNQHTASQPRAHPPKKLSHDHEAQSFNPLQHPYEIKVPAQFEKQIIKHLTTTVVQNDIDYTRFKFFDDEMAEEFSAKARNEYQRWKRNYEGVYNKYVSVQPGSKKPVKIAVLDTGLDLSHPDIVAREESIKERYNWMDSRNIDNVQDSSGHGTHTTGLLLDYAPDAELYVAKIAESDPSDPRTIAAAINYAVQRWEVDIISMSFGFPSRDVKGYDDLYTAIENAHHSGKLLFAAASNSGANLDRAYPARHDEVICIHSVDANGNRSKFSPTASTSDDNFATIGEAVESAWPLGLCDAQGQTYVHKSGTSFATPIAVGIAAFLLEYSKLHLSPKHSKMLKRTAGMRAVLKRIAKKGEGDERRDGYTYVALSRYSDNLFGKSETFIKESIVDALRNS